MKKLKVELEIILDPEVVEEQLSQGSTEEEILEEIENHLSFSIGNRTHPGWEYIDDIAILSIGIS